MPRTRELNLPLFDQRTRFVAALGSSRSDEIPDEHRTLLSRPVGFLASAILVEVRFTSPVVSERDDARA